MHCINNTMIKLVVVVLIIITIIYVMSRERRRVDNSLIKRPKILATECSTDHYIDKNHDMYMYEVNDEIIGYCVYDQHDNHTFIHWLCIDSTHRNLGLGKAFMQDLFRVFVEAGSEYVELVSTRDKRSFYEGLDFVQSDNRGSYRYHLR
jgi:ribosomal protein S18 acetylase RimI-like enzyme